MKLREQNIHLKAIVSGTLFDIVGTIVFGSIFTFVAAIPYSSAGFDPVDIEQHLRGSFLFQFLNIVNGLFFTGMGSYLAARLAKVSMMKHALLTGITSLIIALFVIAFVPGTFVEWYDMATLLLMLPAAALGGHIRRSYVRKELSCSQNTRS